MPAKWHNEINKRKTLHQIKKKGSGAVGKEKDDEKKNGSPYGCFCM